MISELSTYLDLKDPFQADNPLSAVNTFLGPLQSGSGTASVVEPSHMWGMAASLESESEFKVPTRSSPSLRFDPSFTHHDHNVHRVLLPDPDPSYISDRSNSFDNVLPRAALHRIINLYLTLRLPNHSPRPSSLSRARYYDKA